MADPERRSVPAPAPIDPSLDAALHEAFTAPAGSDAPEPGATPTSPPAAPTGPPAPSDLPPPPAPTPPDLSPPPAPTAPTPTALTPTGPDDGPPGPDARPVAAAAPSAPLAAAATAAARTATDDPPLGEHRDGPPRWVDVAVTTVLVAITVITRAIRLGIPRAYVFDEVYYAPEAADLLRRGVEQGGVVHPPMAKWFIAAGIKAVGYTSVGWRLGALVCGTIIVALTYVAARQVVRGWRLPALAGLLVALDGISFTTGRAAMIDVFSALHATVALTAVLIALRFRDRTGVVRACQWACGLAGGLALATKWTAVYQIAICLVAFLGIAALAPPRPHRVRAVLGTLAVVGIVPVAIYAGSYVPWIVKVDQTWAGQQACAADRADCNPSLVRRAQLLVEEHQRIWDFQIGLRSYDNSSAAHAYTWVNQHSPSTLFRKRCLAEFDAAPDALDDQACAGAEPGQVVEITAVANPAVWFPAMAGLAFTVVWSIWRRNLAAGAVAAFVAIAWVPWLVNPRHGYTFYLAPMLPPLALCCVVLLSRRRMAPVAAVVAVAAVAAFGFYYPLWAGLPLSDDALRLRQYWRSY